MTWDNIKDDRLVYTMYKTNRVHSIKLKDKPIAILNKYKDKWRIIYFPILFRPI